jgi:hypothetical protein
MKHWIIFLLLTAACVGQKIDLSTPVKNKLRPVNLTGPLTPSTCIQMSSDGSNFVMGACGGGVGGVNSQTANYAPILSGCGKQISMNGTSLRPTLPNPPVNSTCSISIENVNSTALTTSRNALTIGGVASNLKLAQNQGVEITTDGMNHFTRRGIGGVGVPTGIRKGSALVPSRVSQPPVHQTKPFVDVRDLYDCSYATDSTTALNAATANGVSAFDASQTTFPQGCHLQLGSTWTIQNHLGFLLRGYSSAGGGGSPSFGSPTLSYCGAANGTTLNLQRAHSFSVENIAVEGQGGGCPNPALNGILVDISGPGSLVSTFGRFSNIVVSSSFTGAAANANWTGINFSPTQGRNVEDMRIYDSAVGCSIGLGTGTTTTGINFNFSYNTKAELISRVNVGGCGTGVYQGQGALRIEGGDYGLNGIDINLNGNADPDVVDNVTSEQSGQFLHAAGTWPIMISNNHAAPNANADASHAQIDLNSTSTGQAGVYTLINNGIDPPIAGHAFDPLAANKYAHVTMINNIFGGQKQSGNSQFVMPNGREFGSDYLWAHGGYLRVGNSNQNDISGAEDAGYGFFTSTGYEVPGFGYNNSAFDCILSGGLCIGRDSMFLGNAHILMKGLWPIPYQTITCTVNGTPGAQGYGVAVIAKDAEGKRSGIAVNGNAARCNNAQATLSPTNSLTISWPLVPGAAGGYDVLLYNPADGSQAGLGAMAAAGAATATITANPTYNYSFPNYYESAKTTINGELLAINAHTKFAASTDTPACDANHRFQLNFVAGAIGVKDIVQVCAKDATDAYAWRTVY